jgi:hypothetical protein
MLMIRRVAVGSFVLAAVISLASGGALLAQLPPEAVLLDKVKIPETLKPNQIDPVTLEDVEADAVSWTWNGVEYKGASASKPVFTKEPEKFAAAHKRELYVRNFMLAMSTVWCPITDEVTPGGRKQVDGLGLKWESCCSFCDEEMHPENFKEALAQLRKRAEKSYELTGGKYTEGAKSPVEGAIDENV